MSAILNNFKYVKVKNEFLIRGVLWSEIGKYRLQGMEVQITSYTEGNKSNFHTCTFCTLYKTVLSIVRCLGMTSMDQGSVDVQRPLCKTGIGP